MKTKYHHRIITLLSAGLLASLAHAGVPLNNLEGVGGVAFNPLAYTAGQNKDVGTAPWNLDIVSKPQAGAWYVSLPDAAGVGVDWVASGAAVTWFNRLETSIGHEVIAPDGLKNIHKTNFGTKALLIKENDFDTQWVPAVSVGLVYKDLNYSAVGGKTSGTDYYIVATKLITQLPAPVLVSGGLISTQGYSTGALGFDAKSDEAFFANADVVLLSQFAVGFEYKQGAHFTAVKNADYYDTHLAWLATKQLTLVAAYTNTGSATSSSKVGLGDGLVLSFQYAF